MRSSTWIVAAFMAVVLAGCSGGASNDNSAAAGTTGGSTTGGASGKRLKIAVIPKGSTHEYWKGVHEGANKAAAELGVDIIFKGPEKEDDRDSQIKTVEDFTTQKVDGIVLAPLDNKALVKPVEDAVAAKIPVLVIDSGLDSDKYVSMVSTDNEKGGHIAGAEMVRLLGGKGKVIMLRYQIGSASTDQREKGFLDEVAKSPGITVVSKDQYAGATVATAQTAAENLLPKYKGANGALTVDGIYTPNESSTMGMMLVLQSNHWNGKVKFVGFDASEKLIQGLTGGDVNALVVQNPRKMGYLGVKTLVDSINGKPAEKNIDTGATLVTKANMAQPDVALLLAPPKE